VEAIVQIYTVNGRLVRTLTDDFPFSDGTIRRDDCIEWDGLDDYGDQLARGVYLYQVRLRGDGTNVVNSDFCLNRLCPPRLSLSLFGTVEFKLDGTEQPPNSFGIRTRPKGCRV